MNPNYTPKEYVDSMTWAEKKGLEARIKSDGRFSAKSCLVQWNGLPPKFAAGVIDILSKEN